ncbi:MAG: DUF1707 domain-containing protein [Gemmatimonadota bacterium]|nr:DUF1707 domain-containing protein [Gemmatimonadota bacterium]
MTVPPPVPHSDLEQQRERIVTALSAHFGQDHLVVEELERRLELVYRARTGGELDQLVADLPVLQSDERTQAALTVPDGWPDHGTVLAVMSEAKRWGVWQPPQRIAAVAVMGNVELDFRDAQLLPGVTTVDVLAIMGNVTVRVAPGVGVESTGIGLMGVFEQRHEAPASGSPTLRLAGFALMSNVEVVVKRTGKADDGGPRRLRRRDS